MTSGLKTALRAAISVALLAVLLVNIDTSQVAAALLRTDLRWLGLAFLAALAAWSMNTAKWQRLLATLGRRLPYGYLLALNFVGMFYSVLLPGQISGEVMKGIRLARGGAGAADAAVSIGADRLTGLAGLGLIGIAGLLLAPRVPLSEAMLWLAAAAVAAASAPFLLRKLPLVDRLAAYARSPGTLGLALAQALVFQVLVTLSNYLAALSVGVDIPLVALAWIVAAVSLVHLLPISLAGLGVREGAYVVLLQQYGVPAADGLALSLAVFGVIMAQALLGGVLELSWSGIGPRLLGRAAAGAPSPLRDSSLRSE